MAHRSQRPHIRYEKDQAGCIWGFISIFDFRHGRSAHRLLSDRLHTSREVVGAGYTGSEFHMLKNSNGGSQEIYDGERRDTLVAEVAKTSVKELMEEEMFSEQDQKVQTISADIEAKKIDSERRGRGKKNRKRTSKTSNSSCDIHCELDAAENSCHRNSEEKSSKNLDVEVVMKALCQQLYPKSSSVKHDWNKGLDIQSEQSCSVFDENLIEAIKVFVDERSTDGKDIAEDEKIEQSKEIMDALQALSSNKEMILKLLKGPNSLLVKQIVDLEDAQLEEDQQVRELKVSKSAEPSARKQLNFFRRKSKSGQKFPSKGHEIVILKPGSACVQISESGEKLSPSLHSHQRLGTKMQTDKISSQFSLTGIKRKLKHAMGKERHGVPSDDVTHRFPYKHQNLGSSEKGGWNSPSRNHFYNERFARLAIGIKNKDKSCKPKDTETSMGNETVEYAKLRVYNNLYIEAKKHLTEMLSNGEETEDFSGRQLPKTLGRILSSPEINFSPDFVTAQKRLSPCNDSDMVNNDSWQFTQDNNVSHLGPSEQNSNCQSCITDDPEDTVQTCNSNSDVLDELNSANSVEENMLSMSEKSSEGDIEIVETSQTTDALVHEESIVLDIPVEQCSSLVIRDDENSDLTEFCDEDECVRCLKSDSFEQGPLLSSPLTSPPRSSIIKHIEDPDSANERSEQPSPISVLEPLFTDDDISPTIIKFQPVEPRMQPREIIFGEQWSSSATNQEIFRRACMVEDEESAFDYVEAVLLASDLNWEEFLSRWISSDEILDASLFDEVELFSNRSRHDQMLLFDCTNEVLKEVCERYLGYSPWVSFVKHNIRPIPKGERLIHEVWDEVEWHLISYPSPSTLDQIVGKDMGKTGTWMELRFDVEGVGVEVGEAIFEELVEETMLYFLNEGPQIGFSMLTNELVEHE